MPLLSVIIPFGLSKERPYIKERIIQKACNFKTNENIEFIFVEGFSSEENEMESVIKNNFHFYLKDEKQEKFSQGKCRNLGASFAKSEVLLFLDADCYLSSESFKKILNLIEIKNIMKNPNALLVLPVVYLKQEATQTLQLYNEDLWDCLIQEDLITGKNNLIKFFAPSSTSSLVINKYKFLELGGNDEKFIGHSYEDFDLFARVLNTCVEFKKVPSNLTYDARNWNFYNFTGFRSWFSLLGYESCFYGIYMYHFWHVEPNQDGYMENKDKNHKLFYKHLINLKNHTLKPLQIFEYRNDRILVLYKNKMINFNTISVHMGEFVYKKIKDFFVGDGIQKNVLLDFLKREKITGVFLDSHIKDEKVLEILNKNNLKLMLFQKGILPNSWLFSNQGLKPYEKQNWDLKLTRMQLIEMKNYFLTLNSKQKQKILNSTKDLFSNEEDLYKFLFYLKNELYSFEINSVFYQIILNKKKIFTSIYNKSFYPLNSFIYKPYLYEIKSFRFFSFLTRILGLGIISAKFSQSKFYRLMRKFFFNPKDFFKDSKIKRIKN